MSPSSEEYEQSAVQVLKIADEWRRKGETRRELTALSGALDQLLGVSVARYPDDASGVEFLNGHRAGVILSRMADLNQKLIDELHRVGKPTTAAVDNKITPVHVAWLVGSWDTGGLLLSQCLDPLVGKFFPLTGFWAEYQCAIDSLVAGRPYHPRPLKIRGYEQYWVPHLNLISALTNGLSLAASREEIAESFRKRNSDKRLVDWEMTDGDGKHPVRWDFREAAILKFSEHRIRI